MGHRSAALRALASLWLLPVLALTPRAAAAFPLRSPQVVFSSAALQIYLDHVDGGINALTDQVDNASWISQFFTMGCDNGFAISSPDTTGTCTVGAYSTLESSPALFALLPAEAKRGWSVLCHISSTGTIVAILVDELGTVVGETFSPGFDRAHTGLYVQGPGGTWFTEDARNGGQPQALSFAGTGANQGTVFLCFETRAYDPGGSTFTGEIVQVRALCGVPARQSTWGQLKALYR